MIRPTASLWLLEKLHLIVFYERMGVLWSKVNFNSLQNIRIELRASLLLPLCFLLILFCSQVQQREKDAAAAVRRFKSR